MGGYTLDDNDRAKLSTFGENVYEIVTKKPIVSPYGKNDVYKFNVAQWTLSIGGEFKCSSNYNSIIDEFKFGNKTAEEIFRDSMNSLDDYFGK